MKCYDLKQAEGFSVLHNSKNWRTAIHAYREEVNGISALKEWGRHLDSEEAFLLLEGKALLIWQEEDQEVTIQEMQPFVQYVVGTGQRHAVVLKKGARALIMENQDMSNTVTEKMDASVLENVRNRAEQMG